MSAHNETPVNKIVEMCNAIGFIYINKYSSKGRTYVVYKCKNHSYKGEQETDLQNIKRWYGTKEFKCKCALTHRETEDLKRDHNLNKNVIIIGEYKKSNKKLECECKTCKHRWYATPNKLQQGEGCPECRFVILHEKKKKTQEAFEAQLKTKQPDLKIISEYYNAKSKIKYKCNICGYEGEAIAENLLNLTASCGRCRSTTGERRVSQWLDNNNIKYYRQYAFDECKHERKLRFDFYLPELNTCIEYQGEQHFKPIAFYDEDYSDTLSKYKSQVFRDNIKRDFCTKNDIRLIEIPYWEINHIDSFLHKTID